MALICLFGMSYALRHGEHVRVDVMFAGFSQRNKDFVELLSSLILMAISLIIIWLSISYVMQSWSVGESSANPVAFRRATSSRASFPSASRSCSYSVRTRHPLLSRLAKG